jgi:hypothetical protein
VRVECPEMYTTLSRTPADMKRLYRTHYNTNDNPHSPVYALPDHYLERVSLNDEQQIQMFEKRASMSPEMRAYRCPIVSRGRYYVHAANENNVVYSSWLFYLYFQGLVTQGIIPCMLVSPIKTYPTTTLHLEGRELKRQKLDVMMDFTTEENLLELRHVMHEESRVISPTRLRTHIYVRNAKDMCTFFQDKYPETVHIWRENMLNLPETCTVTHDGTY